MTSPGRYKEGETNRQRVLDYLNANPGASAPDTIKACGFLKNTGSTLLKRMADNGEITRKPIVLQGQFSSYQTFACWAEVKTTISHKEVTANLARNLNGNGFQTASSKVDPERSLPQGMRLAWVNNSNKPALRNQGGQGSYAPRMATYLEGYA